MQLLDCLVEIGFTEYEAKVYLALLGEHPATGYQLSKASGVPRSMVYEALKRLHARGAALESVEDRATLYRPLPPDLLLERRDAEQRRLLVQLRSGLNALYAGTADNRIWSLSGRVSVLVYAAQLVRAAERELFLVLTDADLAVLRDDLTAAHARGVALHVLLTGAGDWSLGQVARHPPLESELQGLTGALLVERDDAELLIGGPTSPDHVQASITRNSDLVLIARQFVWMELFTQRIYARLGPELLARLDPADRAIFESLPATLPIT